jgi:hypothetical protein
MRGWSSRDYPEFHAARLPGTVDFNGQHIRDAVAVGTASKTNGDVMASIAVIKEFGPTRGTHYHVLTADKKHVIWGVMPGPTLLDVNPRRRWADSGRGEGSRWGAICSSAHNSTFLISNEHLRYMARLVSAHVWAR